MSSGIILPSVAFPTVSPTDGLPPKSLLVDVSPDAVVSATAIYATYPIAERKGKSKTGFVAVHPTLFEIHKSQKDFKAKKLAKFFIDFANVFNVCIQNEPVQIKGDCISIMEPADTYLFKPTDSEYSLEAWYEYILEKARECRCNKLARPVFHDEYFEAAWDVMVIKKPKLKKSMEGRRRLCICSTSFLLFNMEAKPTYNPDAAFDKNSFIDLPLNVISNYGCQEKFFFIRIGRCSEIGSGELWMSSESGSSAKAMHEKINSINVRESSKRRDLGVKINYPAISSRVLKSRAHRERSQTANQLQKSESNSKLRVGQGFSDSDKTSKTSSCRSMATTLTNVSSNHSLNAGSSKSGSGSESGGRNAAEGGIFNISSGSCLSSIPEKVRDEITCNSSPQPKKNSIAGLLPFRLSRMSNASMSSTDQQPPLHSPSFNHPDSMALSAAAAHRLSASMKNTKLGSRHLLGSGSKLDRISIDGRQPSQYNCAEDYMTYDASDSGTNHLSNFKSFAGADQSRKSSATYSGILMNHLPGRQYSMGSNSIPISESQQRMSGGSSNAPKDYLEMDVNTLSSNLYRRESYYICL
uniref:IRS-type PTB domain-containing protein n=1 Tax=Ditylenchus dipsaci TaxID=166011 RepID=A0A915EVF9_9BILA